MHYVGGQSRLAGIVRLRQSFFSTFSFLNTKESVMTVDWEFFVPLPGSGMDFSDFVPWSMGCNYIFTIGSPSYNVQRMLTICFNTSSAGRYCPMVTGYRVSRYLLISSSPDLEHEAQSRPEHL